MTPKLKTCCKNYLNRMFFSNIITSDMKNITKAKESCFDEYDQNLKCECIVFVFLAS